MNFSSTKFQINAEINRVCNPEWNVTAIMDESCPDVVRLEDIEMEGGQNSWDGTPTEALELFSSLPSTCDWVRFWRTFQD